MGEELSERDKDAVRNVIAHAALESIEFYEMSARRHEAAPQDQQPGRLSIEAQQRFEDTLFAVRINAKVVHPAGNASVSVAAEYTLLNGYSPSRRTIQLFANEVGIMTVLPYAREALATITGRVFHTPVHLPLIERGEVVLDVDDEEEPGETS